MTRTRPTPVAGYLRRLEAEASARLSPDAAEELVDDLRADLAERLAVDATDADVRTALDRLGTPAELVRAALGEPAPAPPAARAQAPRQDLIALILLISSVLGAGIPPMTILFSTAGIALAVLSRRWRASDKTLAVLTYGPFGGLYLFFLITGRSLGLVGYDQPPAGWILALLIAVPIALHVLTPIRLIRRLPA